MELNTRGDNPKDFFRSEFDHQSLSLVKRELSVDALEEVFGNMFS